MNKEIVIYVDGSCQSDGIGGYGFVLQFIVDGKIAHSKDGRGFAVNTTNQQMELLAALSALSEVKVDFLQQNRIPVIVKSDSKYLVDGMTSWIHDWKRGGWRNAKGKPVANQDLWKRLDAMVNNRLNVDPEKGTTVSFSWVAGHSGIPGNERAHELAEQAAKGAQRWMIDTFLEDGADD